MLTRVFEAVHDDIFKNNSEVCLVSKESWDVPGYTGTVSQSWCDHKGGISARRLTQDNFPFSLLTAMVVKVPFLLQSWGCCLTTEQGIKWAGLQFACSATGLLPVTIWPSNCLQRAAAGTKGNFKTQPSWPQEKLHAGVDAVWLPVPLQQDLRNLCTPQGFNSAAQQSGHRAHLQPPYTAHCSGEDLCSIIGPLSFRKGLTAWSKSSADIYIDFCGHHTQVLHIFWKYIKKDWHPGAALLSSSWGEKKSDHFPGTILR